MDALKAAADGEQVLNPTGQSFAWLHKDFIKEKLGVGKETWKRFRQTRAAQVVFDDS